MRKKEKDWTENPRTHRSNSSPMFNFLEDKITELINDSAFDLVRGEEGHRTVARLILAHLAHKFGMKPSLSLKGMEAAGGIRHELLR